MSIDYRIGYLSRQNRKPFALPKVSLYGTDLTFVHSGAMEYSLNGGERFTVSEGQAVFFPKGEYRERYDGDVVTSYTSIIIYHEVELPLQLPTLIKNVGTHDVKYCLDRLTEINAIPSPFTDGMCDALVRYLFNVLASYSIASSTKRYTYDIQKYIHNHFREKVTLMDVAGYAHISKSHASAIFYKETGQTINHYLTQVRLDEAKKLLTYTDEPLSTIAVNTGFGDVFYFSRMFKRYEKIAPSAYRAKYLNELEEPVIMSIL